MCLDERWTVEKLAAVRAVLWAWGRRAERRPVELGRDIDKHQEQPHEQPSNPRRVRITVKTLEEHRFTEGCRQCRHIKNFHEAKPGLPHSEACRKRITEALSNTAEGNAKLEDYERRADRAIAGRGGEIMRREEPAHDRPSPVAHGAPGAAPGPQELLERIGQVPLGA